MRLIDADALKACLVQDYAYAAASMVDDAPTIDAVEVVRWGNCKHYVWEQEPCHGRVQRFCKLPKGLTSVWAGSFCSYGERRDSDG